MPCDLRRRQQRGAVEQSRNAHVACARAWGYPVVSGRDGGPHAHGWCEVTIATRDPFGPTVGQEGEGVTRARLSAQNRRMGFRFRRRVKLFPGLWVNLSKSGVSTSIGGKGITLNVGNKGTRATVGLPGTGLSYTTSTTSTPTQAPEAARARVRPLVWLASSGGGHHHHGVLRHVPVGRYERPESPVFKGECAGGRTGGREAVSATLS